MLTITFDEAQEWNPGTSAKSMILTFTNFERPMSTEPLMGWGVKFLFKIDPAVDTWTYVNDGYITSQDGLLFPYP